MSTRSEDASDSVPVSNFGSHFPSVDHSDLGYGEEFYHIEAIACVKKSVHDGLRLGVGEHGLQNQNACRVVSLT